MFPRVLTDHTVTACSRRRRQSLRWTLRPSLRCSLRCSMRTSLCCQVAADGLHVDAQIGELTATGLQDQHPDFWRLGKGGQEVLNQTSSPDGMRGVEARQVAEVVASVAPVVRLPNVCVGVLPAVCNQPAPLFSVQYLRRPMSLYVPSQQAGELLIVDPEALTLEAQGAEAAAAVAAGECVAGVVVKEGPEAARAAEDEVVLYDGQPVALHPLLERQGHCLCKGLAPLLLQPCRRLLGLQLDAEHVLQPADEQRLRGELEAGQ
jgi:hypothetical protein